MSEPFLGEIRLFSFAFAPKGWALCNGQVLSIQQNAALFSLMGTYYGGNGVTTFQLPDLRGRVSVGVGSGYDQGAQGGEETVTLITSQMPQHNHYVQASTANGTSSTYNNAIFAAVDPSTKVSTQTPNYYAAVASPVQLQAETKATGSGLPHLNMQPYLVGNYCIALQGIFPSRS